MARDYILLQGEEGEALSRELDKRIKEAKAKLDKHGVKSYEGVVWKDGEPKSIDEDD